VTQRGTKGVSKVFPKAVVASATAETQPALMERLRVWIEDAVPSSVAGAQRAMARRTDATPLLSAIRVPTLVIVGEEDPTTPPAEAAAIAAAIPGAKLVRIPGAGHLSNLEQPEAFNAAVREFMGGFRP
jgi:pimeloyl-ACP methyl ester carboxylesterase